MNKKPIDLKDIDTPGYPKSKNPIDPKDIDKVGFPKPKKKTNKRALEIIQLHKQMEGKTTVKRKFIKFVNKYVFDNKDKKYSLDDYKRDVFGINTTPNTKMKVSGGGRLPPPKKVEFTEDTKKESTGGSKETKKEFFKNGVKYCYYVKKVVSNKNPSKRKSYITRVEKVLKCVPK